MWSHYADCHRGICLGFDAENLQKNFNYNLQPIIYQEDFYRFDKFPNPIQTLNYLLTKSSVWSYEDEVRLFLLEKISGSIQYDKSILKEVIFGINMDKKNADLLASYLEQNFPHVIVKYAMRNSHEFSIDIT